MRSVTVVLSGLAFLIRGACFAQSLTPEQILGKVSQTYSDLRSFHLVRLVSSEPKTGLPQAWSDPFSSGPAPCETDLALSTPGKIRLGVSSREAEISFVSDGRKTWVYIPDLKEFEEVAAAPLLQELWVHPMNLISDDLARDPRLSQEASRAKLRGEEKLILEGQKVLCYVVDLQAGSVWRTLWVDEQSFIVLRDKGIPSPGSPPAIDYGSNPYFVDALAWTSRITKMDLGPLSNDVFQFAVPSGARLVESFSAPAGPVQFAEERLAGLLIGSKTYGESVVQPAAYGLQGSRAHDFAVAGLGGEKVRLDGLHGKIVVLDFWASWCKPCQEELAAMQKLHDELASKGVVFLGIDEENPETVKSFVKAQGYSFPMLLDSEQTVHGLYGVRLVPTTVVIDRKGKIAAHFVGAGGEAQLRRALKKAGL